jgi:hypothetical protein
MHTLFTGHVREEDRERGRERETARKRERRH